MTVIELDRTHLPDAIPLVVACSGGSDSLALLHLLQTEAGTCRWSLTVAHLDHALRPDAADDAAFVQAEAARLGLACVVRRVDVKRERRGGESLEGAARRLRYAFLQEVRTGLGPRARIATGHTADDQLETLLLRLHRGSGLRGLRGILAARSDGVVRPLLAVRRSELQRALAALGLGWREDATNRDVSIPRNRLRRGLETLSEGAYAEALEEAMTLTRRAARLQPLLERLARCRLLAGRGDGTGMLPGEILLERFGNPVHLDTLGHACLDAALTETGADPRTVPARLRAALLEGLHPGAEHRPAGILQVGPRLWAERVLTGLLLVSGPAPRAGREEGKEEEEEEGIPLPAPERTGEAAELPLPRGGRLRVSLAEPAVVAALARGEHLVGVDGAETTVVAGALEGLRLRYARPGDRMRPFGAPGRRRLSDVLAEAGVPRLRRDRLPVVVGPEGIVWVAGVRTAECGRVRRPDERALLLTFVRTVPGTGMEWAGGITPSREERP